MVDVVAKGGADVCLALTRMQCLCSAADRLMHLSIFNSPVGIRRLIFFFLNSRFPDVGFPSVLKLKERGNTCI